MRIACTSALLEPTSHTYPNIYPTITHPPTHNPPTHIPPTHITMSPHNHPPTGSSSSPQLPPNTLPNGTTTNPNPPPSPKPVFFFDVDNCLYPKSAQVHTLMSNLIDTYFQTHLSLTPTQSLRLHNSYYKSYGLAIEGLVRHHKIDPLEYNRQVDDALPLESVLSPLPALRQLLLRIDRSKVKLWLFTNAYKNHALRVVKILGVEDCFDGLTYCDYAVAPILCKPRREMFLKAMREARVERMGDCWFVDDSYVNCLRAQEMGWTTVHLLEPEEEEEEEQQARKEEGVGNKGVGAREGLKVPQAEETETETETEIDEDLKRPKGSSHFAAHGSGEVKYEIRSLQELPGLFPQFFKGATAVGGEGVIGEVHHNGVVGKLDWKAEEKEEIRVVVS